MANASAVPSGLAGPPDADRRSLPERTLVLCFDGTCGKFGENVTNVVRFFHALKKDEPEKQLVYYQAGIGTYVKRQFFTQTAATVSRTLDSAVALHLNDHVKDGYKFLMQNYRERDKICLFGFSRGAYTARALAGMLYKVGLLPRDNDEQVDFAFSIYQSTNRESSRLSREFKDIFSIDVTLEFVGVWDTVSSVGIIPRQLPYSTISYGINTFRHALALDERRARFRASIWNEPGISVEELDDDPILERRPRNIPRDDWDYKPPKRRPVDAVEVWFAGCHSDVGGGAHDSGPKSSLSNITLRWMIKQCYLSETGILFSDKLLESFGLDPDVLRTHPSDVHAGDANIDLLAYPKDDHGPSFSDVKKMMDLYMPGIAVVLKRMEDAADALAPLFDELTLAPPWWILELIPMLGTYQQEDGSWIRRRRRNFGNGRYIPHSDYEIKVHVSVLHKIRSEKGYTPAAYNWSDAINGGLIRWVE